VGVLGASGYVGQELLRLLARHPGASVAFATAESAAGEWVEGHQLIKADDAPFASAEVVFSALPHGVSARYVHEARAAGKRAVDLSADFRLSPDAVYGLTEFTRPRLADADLVANPGCYPTAALLALLPALKAGLVTEDIIVDAKSGVSGAGHAVEDAYLFGTIDESVRPYGVPKHRHTPEIAQEAAALLGKPLKLTFTPHLVPMNRGLVASCYAPLRSGKTAKDVAEAYAKEYAEEPFVRVIDSYPATKATLGSNWCIVHALVDEENARLVAFAALDNLVKGAAGSALQNFNARFGYPETMGLEALPLWP